MATKLPLKDESGGLGSMRGPLTSAMAGTQSARRRQMQLQVKLAPNTEAHPANEDDSDVLSDLHAHSAAAASSSSSSAASASSAAAERFKLVEKELGNSIPEKERTLCKDWKVKQLVISKPDNSNVDLPIATNLVHGHEGKQQVSRSPAMQAVRRLSRQGTSKIQKFKPSVSLSTALQWLSEYGRADSTVIFDNNCAIMYTRGTFSEFEDVRDEEEAELRMHEEEDS